MSTKYNYHSIFTSEILKFVFLLLLILKKSLYKSLWHTAAGPGVLAATAGLVTIVQAGPAVPRPWIFLEVKDGRQCPRDPGTESGIGMSAGLRMDPEAGRVRRDPCPCGRPKFQFLWTRNLNGVFPNPVPAQQGPSKDKLLDTLFPPGLVSKHEHIPAALARAGRS